MPKADTLTPHHRKVLDLLRKNQKPMSAYDILAKLGKQGFRAPPTVYRALEALIRRGLVHKIQSLNAFIACHVHDAHEKISQFAICRSCGAVEELHDDAVPKALAKLKLSFLHEIESQILEIVGLCRACAAPKKA